MLTSDLIGPTWSIKYQANAIDKMQIHWRLSHQDSSQRNQAQESCSKTYEK